ncbi:MAG: SAVED domain-containing protein [Promethearchaeota archaeon]
MLEPFYKFSINFIPLVIHFGFLLKDTRKVKCFQFHRISGKWNWPNSTGKPYKNQLNLDDSRINVGNKNGNMVIVVELSSRINEKDYIECVPEFGGIVKLGVDEPSVRWLQYEQQLKEFKEAFYKIFSLILNKNLNLKKLHIFYSGPNPCALEIGRAINPTMFPEVYLYNYYFKDEKKYHFTFKL